MQGRMNAVSSPHHISVRLVSQQVKVSSNKVETNNSIVASKQIRPNVVVEWLTLLLRIRQIPGSNLGPGYPD
jgi:hypothetical protein